MKVDQFLRLIFCYEF